MYQYKYTQCFLRLKSSLHIYLFILLQLHRKFTIVIYAYLIYAYLEPEFYGDLVYKLKKLKGINDFSLQFGKIISRYRRIGYNLNVMRQSSCLVFNPIMVDNYAAFFNCTPVGRASDSMMAPT